MRTSLSRTTGRGVPAGTSNGIAPGEPAPVSEPAGRSVCPNINPADIKIKTRGDGKGRIGSILTFDFRSAAAKQAGISYGRNTRENRPTALRVSRDATHWPTVAWGGGLTARFRHSWKRSTRTQDAGYCRTKP